MKTRRLQILTAISLAISHVAVADDDIEKSAVIRIVDAFFTAMAAKDVDSMRLMMLPEGTIVGYRESADGPELVHLTHATYLGNLAASEDRVVERYWDPTILLRERLATVWTYYDLYRNDKFSHCGINNFSFVKTAEGWRIAGVVFSMQRESCAASPLGPYQADNEARGGTSP